MGDYRVRFEVFEGPLDLLLYLIRKEEVDIYEVNLTKIATEFIEYLNLMRELDLDVAGEFVVMAATLMLIKSRELLPRDQRPEGQTGEEEEQEDPRWELIRQLVEYRKFKDAAARLHDLEVRAENTYPRIPGRVELPEDASPRRSEATIFDLLAAVNAVLKRFSDRVGEARDVFEDKWSVSEKIQLLVATLRDRPTLRFSELFHASTSRAEVVVTFLAVLELIRLRMIVAAQDEAFAEIAIAAAPTPATPGPAAVDAASTRTDSTTVAAAESDSPAPTDPGAPPEGTAFPVADGPSVETPAAPEPPPLAAPIHDQAPSGSPVLFSEGSTEAEPKGPSSITPASSDSAQWN
jgi:segregation and condensation protein A